MILQRTAAHSLSGLGALALIAGAVAGCAPAPAPTPTPTAAFANEKEAFTKAEETYREYSNATNQTELSAPDTFESVFEWLTGEAETSARENYSDLRANGITRSGASTFDTFSPISYDGESVRVELCIDVSQVRLINAEGVDVSPPDRPERQPVQVTFLQAQTPTKLAIASSTAAEELQC